MLQMFRGGRGWFRGLGVLCLGAALSCGGDDSSSGSAATGASNAGTSATSAGTGAAGMAASTPKDPPATFTEVYSMLFPMTTNARCVACHSMPANDIANGNLQMGAEKATAYAALVGHTSTSTRCMNRALVVPAQPEMSLLVQKLSANPPCGSRMPLGGNMLSDAQLSVVRGWIEAGAKDD
jgi:hypothetical protein